MLWLSDQLQYFCALHCAEQRVALVRCQNFLIGELPCNQCLT